MFMAGPLAYAVSYGKMAVARFFLDKGADLNKQAQDGIVRLHEAAREYLTFCTCLDFYRHFVTTFSL
jgi:hypothetical protein